MRFLLKSAFWLGLIAFFLAPGGAATDGEAPQIDVAGAFFGIQEAVSDLTGFCERSPAACAAGEQLAGFAADRIGDGLVLAYGFAAGTIDASEEGAASAGQDAIVPPAVVAAMAKARAATQQTVRAHRADPVTTAAVRPQPVPTALPRPASHESALLPFAMPGVAPSGPAAETRLPSRTVADVPAAAPAEISAASFTPAIPTPAPRA